MATGHQFQLALDTLYAKELQEIYASRFSSTTLTQNLKHFNEKLTVHLSTTKPGPHLALLVLKIMHNLIIENLTHNITALRLIRPIIETTKDLYFWYRDSILTDDSSKVTQEENDELLDAFFEVSSETLV